MSLVLSLFPGAGLLDEAFRIEGYHVVCAPDKIWGGDIRAFHAPPGKFNGLIGGSPCQDFSRLRRTPPTGDGVEMLVEYCRIVEEAQPEWFLLENVEGVHNIAVEGYKIQRLNLNARECGLRQRRPRCFQFGNRRGLILTPERQRPQGKAEPACLATEGESVDRRGFADFCEAMGLPRDFDLPGLSIAAKYRAVGNGVPIPLGRTIARAVREACLRTIQPRVCICDCGRIVTGEQIHAGASCRKRMERRRKSPRLTVTPRGVVALSTVTVEATAELVLA